MRYGGERFQALWTACDGYKRAKEKHRLMPTRYECAAPFCRFQTMKGRQLKRCAGGYPPELKSSYCSKACQPRDWAK
ncbi:hypothetical protein C8Q80DRAFT_327068 [Daedaleopsis nitida]|nr:hypothetical protein C8Q80DRAFT_327068 [Daedaleopsis nitida]